VSVLAEPPVAVVDGVVKRKGTEKIADAYLRGLYTPEGQEIIASNYYRPSDPAVAKKYASRFPQIPLLQVDKDFGGWAAAHKKFFADGGIFDQIYVPK
jgi:sulfate transport system substrate-binding protein